MENDSIQAPKQSRAKKQVDVTAPVIAPPVTPAPVATAPVAPVVAPTPKPKKQLSEAQKATLAKGRANLKAKKEQQLKETAEYKDNMVLLRAEQLKLHKKNIKKSVGLPEVSDEDDEELVVKIEPRKRKPKKKVVYISESESEEEEIIYKKTRRKAGNDNTPPPAPPNTPARGGLTFY
jgi:hypothetical protein